MADQADPTTTTTTTQAATRTEFAATLIDLDKGRIHDDATDRLAELVDAVCHTAQAGTMTITVKVEPLDPQTFEDDGTLMVTGEVKVSIPRLKRAPSVFYATGVDGQMSRSNPGTVDPRADRD